MKIIKIECPSCGAAPEVDKNMEFGFCSYCGTKIYIPNAVMKIKGTVSVDKSGGKQNCCCGKAGGKTQKRPPSADLS